MVVFCDAKQSKVQIIQSIGRGTRKYPCKTDCLVTVLADYKDSVKELTQIEDTIVRAKFNTINYICKALKDIDKRIEDVM